MTSMIKEISLSISLSIYLSIYLSTYLSIYLSIYLLYFPYVLSIYSTTYMYNLKSSLQVIQSDTLIKSVVSKHHQKFFWKSTIYLLPISPKRYFSKKSTISSKMFPSFFISFFFSILEFCWERKGVFL